MADWGQFGERFGELDAAREVDKPSACQVCEAMLPDAVDGALSEAEQRAFDRHVAGCMVCARELEEAKRGAAWLGMLKQQAPEPGPMLLERILTQTTGAADSVKQTTIAPVVQSAPAPPKWASLPVVPVLHTPQTLRPARKASAWESLTEAFSLEWMRPVLQPRMAMTAAMAFFSIALTLNLTGVRLSTISAASLRPATLRRTFAEKGAAAVRGFQNSRVVYQTEAQVDDLRSTWHAQEDQATRATPEQSAPDTPKADQPPADKQGASNKDDKQAAPNKPQGSSQLDFTPAGLQGGGTTKKGA